MRSVCIECRKSLLGRSDKKFCDTHCKNAYHNRRNSEQRRTYHKVQTEVHSNFRILMELRKKNISKVHRSTLEFMGFKFERSTRIIALQDGQFSYFCFNLGIKPLENGYFVLADNYG